MADHFRNVKDRMRSGSRSDDDGWEDIPQQNELTRDLRKGG